MKYKKVKITDLVSLINGHPFKPEDWGLEGKKIIRIQNLNNPDANFNLTNKEINSKYLVNKGDILIAWSGSLGVYEWDHEESALLNQHIFKVVFKTNWIDKRYFKYVIKQALIELSYKTRGVGLKHLNKGQIDNYEFNLPEIEEQKKSVTILQNIESLIDKRKKTYDLVEEFLQSTFEYRFGDPYFNPKNYPVLKLKNLVKDNKIITYGIVQAGPEVKGGVPYIKSGDIKEGKILIEKLSRTSSEISAKYERSRCTTGDIIISMRGTVGAVAMLPEELNGCNLTQGTSRISANEDVVDKYYLLSALSHKGGQAKVKKHEQGSTFKEITLKKLREVEIMIPPVEQQRKFAALYNSIDFQKTLIKKSLNLFEDLFQVFIYQTFNPVKIESLDEIDSLMKDDIRLEEFLNSFNNSAIESQEEYDIAIKKLYEILKRTQIHNKSNTLYLKGIVQTISGNKIVLESNKENKYRTSDEITTT